MNQNRIKGQLLDHRGVPFESNGSNGSEPKMTPSTRRRRIPRKKAIHSVSSWNDLNSWYASLASTRLPPLARAQDPFGNHPWVFAAGVAIAVTASQAPFTIFRETEEAEEARASRYRKSYKGTHRKFGKERRALQRYSLLPVSRRVRRKGLEPDYDHPLNTAFIQANPYQTGNQLWMMTHLWMAVRGEVFWVMEAEDGGPVIGDNLPDRIWPLSPDLFEPIYENGTWGELIGWWFCPPRWMSKYGEGVKLALPLTDVIQFKYSNPVNPVRGLSRISAVAMNVETDMLAKEYNRQIIQNGGDPGGLLIYDADLDEEEEKEYIAKWEQTHGGPENAKRTAVLSGGFSYQQVALSPKDMEFLEQQGWDREEILAVMGVPRSVLGVPDQNYATQLGQDANFWDKTLIPMLKVEESTLDSTVFFEQPDNVVGLFDLKDIEALRAGVGDKVKIAMDLASDKLHADPKTAYEVVGLEIDEYEQDEVAFVSPMNVPASSISSLDEVGGETPTSPTEPDEEAPDDGTSEPAPPLPTRSFELAMHRLERVCKTRVEDFAKVEEPLEKMMGRHYRGWVGGERTLFLDAYDAWAEDQALRLWHKPTEEQIHLLLASFAEIITRQVPPDLIISLPDLTGSKARLSDGIRPIYSSILQQTFNFTVDELGVPVFNVDNELFYNTMNVRQVTFVNSVPTTLYGNLQNALVSGFEAGETVQSIRQRVAQVFDIAASSAKALQVSRTETASLMNDLRDDMFELQGVEREKWSTAKDEVVRDTHKVYGKLKAKERGYNYLEETGKEGFGTLTHPGDTRCRDLSELINCRCIKVPVF